MLRTLCTLACGNTLKSAALVGNIVKQCHLAWEMAPNNPRSYKRVEYNGRESSEEAHEEAFVTPAHIDLIDRVMEHLIQFTHCDNNQTHATRANMSIFMFIMLGS